MKSIFKKALTAALPAVMLLSGCGAKSTSSTADGGSSDKVKIPASDISDQQGKDHTDNVVSACGIHG